MIIYDSNSWSDTLLRWRGTPLKACVTPSLIFMVYISLTYAWERYVEKDLGHGYSHSKLLGGAVSFLLVFRANASYGRYVEGQRSCIQFFACLRDLNMVACTTLRGGRGQMEWNRRCGEDGFSMERKRCLDDSMDAAASQLRCEMARWSLCLAIAFRVHMRLTAEGYLWGAIDDDTKHRLNWERMRLRGLMSGDEFQAIDQALRVQDTGQEDAQMWSHKVARPEVFHPGFGETRNGDEEFLVSTEPGTGQMLIIFFRIMQLVRAYMHEPFSYKERFSSKFVHLSTELFEVRDKVQQAMTTPLPLPYVNLVRVLLFVYLLSMPFFNEFEEGIWANIIMPTMLATALFGIEEIGTELENPFGNDANDLDVQDMISTLEMALMRMLDMVGDAEARQRFTWLPVPAFMQEETSTPFKRYLALKSEVSHSHIPSCSSNEVAALKKGTEDPTSICIRRRGTFDGGLSVRRVTLGPTPEMCPGGTKKN